MRGTLLLLTAFAVGFAPAPFARPPRPADKGRADLRLMQGEWDVILYHVHGLDLSKTGPTRVVIVGEDLTWRQQTFAPLKWVIRIVPGRRPVIDLIERSTDKVFPGIYKVEEDQLTICTAEPQVGLRPVAFDARERGFELMVLKRIKR